MVAINSRPVAVGNIDLRCLAMYLRRKRVSIMAARVEGRPMAFYFKASRKESSSTFFPAVSIALSKVASV